jgi:hypothetical protein
MDYKIHTVKYLLRDKYPEVYILASGGDNRSDFDRAVIMDEFFQHRYIVGDLDTLLFNMKEKIKSFD